MVDHPLLVFVATFAVLWVSGWLGVSRFRRLRAQIADVRDDFSVIQGATLTLLGLIIGFTFSMALGRYDQRKNLEEEEANAIGTEYVRADLLPAADAERVRTLLRRYLDVRVQFYTIRDEQALAANDAATAKLQAELWAVVRQAAAAQPTPITALVVAGMNDVLNAQGYTQAAWWNRIPIAAWAMMLAIAICSTLLVGVGAKEERPRGGLLVILPLVLAIAFFLIADIDSPRWGVIRVAPKNLTTLVDSLRTAP
ncbi:MAG: hypothetical protein U1F10_10005 [Burkholderiales bacterium]